jgi:hypothetical protein
MGPSANPVKKRTTTIAVRAPTKAVLPEKTPDNTMRGASHAFFKPVLSASGVTKREDKTKPNPVYITISPVWALFRLNSFINTGNRSAIAFLSSSTSPQVTANRLAIAF